MRRTIHMCVDIAGVLRWPDNKLKGMFTHDNGQRPKTGREVRDFLKLQLAMGKRVLPMGKCEGFDYQTGCPGHEVQEDTAAGAAAETGLKELTAEAIKNEAERSYGGSGAQCGTMGVNHD